MSHPTYLQYQALQQKGNEDELLAKTAEIWGVVSKLLRVANSMRDLCLLGVARGMCTCLQDKLTCNIISERDSSKFICTRECAADWK